MGWAFADRCRARVCGASGRGAAARKNFRIGYLDSSTASGIAVLVEAFRQELNKLGWSEGKNITIEYRFASKSLSAYLSLRRSWFVLRSI